MLILLHTCMFSDYVYTLECRIEGAFTQTTCRGGLGCILPCSLNVSLKITGKYVIGAGCKSYILCFGANEEYSVFSISSIHGSIQVSSHASNHPMSPFIIREGDTSSYQAILHTTGPDFVSGLIWDNVRDSVLEGQREK